MWRSRALLAAAGAHARQPRSRSAISARCPSRKALTRSPPRSTWRSADAVARRAASSPSTVPPCGAAIASSIFIDSSTRARRPPRPRRRSRRGRAAPCRASAPPASRRRRPRRRARARATRSLEVVPVAGDPERVAVARERVARARRRRASTAHAPPAPTGRGTAAPRHVALAGAARAPSATRTRRAPRGAAGTGRRGVARAGGGERGGGQRGPRAAAGGGSARIALEQPGVQLARAHVLALEQRARERRVGRHAEQLQLAERARPAAAARSGGPRAWAITFASIGS